MFTAQYSGDANFQGSVSTPEPLRLWSGDTGAVIEPPGTVCPQVESDIAHESAGRSRVTVRAHASGGTIGQKVTPPYLTYYVRLVAPSSSFQVNVSQAPPSPLPPLAAPQRARHPPQGRLAGDSTPIPQRDDHADECEDRRQQADSRRLLLRRDQVHDQNAGGQAMAVRRQRHGLRHLPDDDIRGWPRAEFDSGAAGSRPTCRIPESEQSSRSRGARRIPDRLPGPPASRIAYRVGFAGKSRPCRRGPASAGPSAPGPFTDRPGRQLVQAEASPMSRSTA